MTHEEILSQLRDIHSAEPLSFWPPAPGYYVVLLLFAIFLVVAIFCVRKILRLKFRKLILREVQSIEDHFLAHHDVSFVQASLSALFRRLAFFGKKSLSKNCELDEATLVLVRMMPNQKRMLAIIELLKRDRYHKDPQVDGALLISLSREQIKRCRI